MKSLQRFTQLVVCSMACLGIITSCYTTKYYTQPVEADLNNTYLYMTRADIVEAMGTPSRVDNTIPDPQQIQQEVLRYDDAGNKGEFVHFYMGPDGRCTAVKSNRQPIRAVRERSKPTKGGIIGGACGTAAILGVALYFIIQEIK